jgi:hypothetical protein
VFFGGRLAYIGRTKHLFSRIASHFQDGRAFDAYSYLTCDETELHWIERWAIEKYRPEQNKV